LNPLTGAVLSDNQISTSYFDQGALALAKYIPTITNPCGIVSYAIPNVVGENQIITRVDGTLNQKNSFCGRYFLDGYTDPAYYSPTNILVGNSTGSYKRVQSLTLADTCVFNSKTVNTFHATGTRRRINRGTASDGINALLRYIRRTAAA
jgi:hypothetical protein